MNWKQKALLCALLSVVATGTLASAITDGSPDGASYLTAPPAQAASVTKAPQGHQEQQSSETCYVLKPLGGLVAVYLEGAKAPLLVTDIEIKNLREMDRKLLEAGFTVEGRSGLMELLEDLGS